MYALCAVFADNVFRPVPEPIKDHSPAASRGKIGWGHHLLLQPCQGCTSHKKLRHGVVLSGHVPKKDAKKAVFPNGTRPFKYSFVLN